MRFSARGAAPVTGTVALAADCFEGEIEAGAQCAWHEVSGAAQCGFEEISSTACKVFHWFGSHKNCQEQVDCEFGSGNDIAYCKAEFANASANCGQDLDLASTANKSMEFDLNISSGQVEGDVRIDYTDNNNVLEAELRASFSESLEGMFTGALPTFSFSKTNNDLGFNMGQGDITYSGQQGDENSSSEHVHYSNVFNTPMNKALDFNGDGYGDLLAKFDWDDFSTNSKDELWVSWSGKSELQLLQDLSHFANGSISQLEFGDVNGDGSTDILLLVKNYYDGSPIAKQQWFVSYSGITDWQEVLKASVVTDNQLSLSDEVVATISTGALNYAGETIKGGWLMDLMPGKAAELVLMTESSNQTVRLFVCQIMEDSCVMINSESNGDTDVQLLAMNLDNDQEQELMVVKSQESSAILMATLFQFNNNQWSSPTVPSAYENQLAFLSTNNYAQIGNFQGMADSPHEILLPYEKDEVGRWSWKLYSCTDSVINPGSLCSGWQSSEVNQAWEDPRTFLYSDLNGDQQLDVLVPGDVDDDEVVDWQVSYSGTSALQLYREGIDTSGTSNFSFSDIPYNLWSSGAGINNEPDYRNQLSDNCVAWIDAMGDSEPCESDPITKTTPYELVPLPGMDSMGEGLVASYRRAAIQQRQSLPESTATQGQNSNSIQSAWVEEVLLDIEVLRQTGLFTENTYAEDTSDSRR
jgi:hypothetical protein